MAESSKRQKRDHFLEFHNNEVCKAKLNAAVTALDSPRNGFCLLNVKNCNADAPISFSSAYCQVERNTDFAEYNSVQDYYLFYSIFDRGFDAVKSLLSNPEDVPTRRGEKMALERLLDLFTDISECERAIISNQRKKKTTNKNKKDKEWTVTLAHHLLSKLSLNQSYVLDSNSTYMENIHRCPCCSEDLTGEYGDTSMGTKAGWHGYVDILVGVDPVPVQFFGNEPQSPHGNESSLEIEVHDDYSSFREQILAETIVFSFVTKIRHPEYSNFLIPTIGITKSNVYIYFYDCENDILLESTPLPILITNKQQLNLSTVFALWLVFNYQYFCRGTLQLMKETGFKANFLKFIEPFSKVYQEDAKLGCGSSSRDIVPFNPYDSLWLTSRRTDKNE